jgi:microcystin-dependent protein
LIPYTGPVKQRLPYPNDSGTVHLGGAAFRSLTDQHFSWYDQVPTGMVVIYAGKTVPNGWLECDGSSIDSQTHHDLCTVLTGDPAATTAALPDLRARFPVGADTDAPFRPHKSTGRQGTGVPNITETHMPAHAHGNSFSFSNYGTVAPSALGGGAHSHYMFAEATTTFAAAPSGTSGRQAWQVYCEPGMVGCVGGSEALPPPNPATTARIMTGYEQSTGVNNEHIHDNHNHTVYYSINLKINRTPEATMEYTPRYIAMMYIIKT